MTDGASGVLASMPAQPPKLIRQSVSMPDGALGGLEPGCWLFGLTKGQYSLLDLIRAVVAKTGPADVRLSTWSTGIRDAEAAGWMLGAGEFTSFQMIVDRSFPSRQPQYVGRMVALFGQDAIIPTRVHAKIALIRAGDWRIVVRSSMNLNRNPRFEQWDLNDAPELFDFVAEWFDELAATAPHGLDFEESEQEAAFQAAMRGEVGVAEIVSQMTGMEVATVTGREAKKQRIEAAAAEGESPLLDIDEEGFQRWMMQQAIIGLQSAEPGGVAHGHAMREVRTARKALAEIAEEQRLREENHRTPEQVAASAAAEMGDCDDEQLFSMVEAAILALPDPLVARVRDAAIARLEPGPVYRPQFG